MDKDGKPKLVATGFGQVYKQDRANSISEALDNISRYNLFMNYGYEIYQEELDKNPDTKMIDFTLKNSKDAVVAKME